MSSKTLSTAGVGANDRFADLVQGLDAIVWEMDAASWTFTFVNRRAEEILGYPAEQWLSEPGFWAERLLHPDDRARAVAFCTRATREARDHELEYRAVAADGRVVVLRDLVRVIPGDDGAPRLLRGVMIDITAQKRTERRLQERERQLAEAQRLAQLGSWSWRVGAERVEWSDTLYRIFGVPPGSPVSYEAYLQRIHPADRDRVARIVARARETGERYRLEHRVVHPDGRVRHVFSQGDVELGDQGRPVRLFGIAQDVTERREAAERAHQLALETVARQEEEAARRQVQQILESITDAFFALDLDWRFTYVNEAAARVLQRARDDLIGNSVWEVFPAALGSTFERMYRRAVDAQATVEFVEFYPPLQTWFEVKAFPAAEGLSVYFRDVGDRKAAEQELRHQSELLRTITDNATAALFMMDARGHCTFMNPAAEEMTGYTLDEIRDRPLHDAIHHHHPDGRPFPMAECPIDRALPENNDIRAHEDVFIRRNGEFFPVTCAARPIVRDGVPVGTLVEVRDVTERRVMEERQRFLVEVGALLASSLDYETTLASVAHLAVPTLADWCAIDLLDEAGGLHRVEVAHTDPAKRGLARELERRYPHDPEATVGVSQVLRSGEPELVDEISDELVEASARDAEHLRILRELGLRSFMVVPLTARGRTLGAVTLVTAESGRRYTPDDLETAQELALRAAFAVDNARLVAQLQRTLEELRASERGYRVLAESIPQLVWTTTPDGYHDYFNERWYDYTGMPREGQQGWNWKDYLHPDDHDHALEVWHHSLRTGEPYQIEYRLRRAEDGQFRWFLGRALALRDADGNVFKWFGTCTDIHDRKEADAERDRLIAELGLERARLSSVFVDAPAYIATLRGPDHVFEMANPRYLQLVGHREVVGRPVREALPEVVGQGFIELLDRVYRGGEPYIGNEVGIVLQAEPDAPPVERFLNFVYQPISDARGATTGIFVHAVDVTNQVEARREVERKAEELARLAAALERSNRELDQFAYVTSHDLRAPLRGIANLAQWIEEDLPGQIPAEVQEHLELLRGRVHRMEGLIEGILRYSRAGRVRGEVEEVDTAALAHEVVELLDPPESLRVEIAPGLPVLRTERLPLQQVLMNLVGNAVKYVGRADGRIEVAARKSNGTFEFSVADNGPGIAPEYHDRIFGIFQTLEARDKVEGTGIGLSLVKKIVEQRGGRVWVESGEGAGATFRFTWPA